MLFYACLVLWMVSLVMFLIQRKPLVSLRVLFFKTVASSFVFFTALTAYYENQDSCNLELALLFFAGCVSGLLGDIWLDAKYIFPSEKNGLLKAGFISFLIGHVFYSFAMFITYGVSKLTIICGIIGVVFGPLSCWVTEKTMKVNFGKSKLISMVYTSVLTFTTGIAVAIAIENSFQLFSVLRVVGMILFVASDGVLAQIYFSDNKNTRVNVVINHALYYVAQILMASSLFVS